MQAYDFLYLYEKKDCKLQMGGSDQWGNMTAGAELIRKKIRGEAYALTTNLITKADGGKFGKTEQGNVWLDPKKTSPYRFYQFWLNVSDEDALRFIRIFTLFDKQTIAMLEEEHKAAPHLRSLQKTLAKNITIRVHSERDYEAALESSEILFGKGTKDSLLKLSDEDINTIFEGVPQISISHSTMVNEIPAIDFLTTTTANQIFSSKGEVKRTIESGSLLLNKEKVGDSNISIGNSNLINGKYMLIQKGKKNYYLIRVTD
jgi:tyrosyl-tRNA synthetase